MIPRCILANIVKNKARNGASLAEIETTVWDLVHGLSQWFCDGEELTGGIDAALRALIAAPPGLIGDRFESLYATLTAFEKKFLALTEENAKKARTPWFVKTREGRWVALSPDEARKEEVAIALAEALPRIKKLQKPKG